MRFYRYADTEQPGEDVEDPSTGHFRAFQLFEIGDRKSWKVLQKEFEAAVKDTPGVITEVRELAGGPQSGKDIRLQITSLDRSKAFEAARKIRDHMKFGMEGLKDFDDDMPLPGCIELRGVSELGPESNIELSNEKRDTSVASL